LSLQLHSVQIILAHAKALSVLERLKLLYLQIDPSLGSLMQRMRIGLAADLRSFSLVHSISL